jgi:hypothetical protein
MEKPDYILIKKRFDLLHAFLLQLQELAQLQQWDDFEFAWPEYEKLTIDLPNIDWFEFSEQERINLEDVLLKVMLLHSNLQVAAVAWQDELQGMIKGLAQANRVSDKYL